MSNLYFNGPKSAFSSLLIAMPDPQISYGSSFTTEVRLNEVKFGDGYSQRSLDGINNTPIMLDFRFANRDLAVISEIDKFLRGDKVFYDRTPEEYFYYIPPPPYDGGALGIFKKFVCRKWSLTSDEFNNHTITGTFEEVFDA